MLVLLFVYRVLKRTNLALKYLPQVPQNNDEDCKCLYIHVIDRYSNEFVQILAQEWSGVNVYNAG